MRPRRNAYTLVECLAMFFLTGTALLILVAVLHALHRADHRLQHEHQYQHNLERFIRQLRIDCHASESATLADDARTVTLADGGSKTIQYVLAESRIDRNVQQSGSSDHRESYHFRQAAKAEWSIDRSGATHRLLVRVPWNSGSRGQPARLEQEYTLTATIGVVP